MFPSFTFGYIRRNGHFRLIIVTYECYQVLRMRTPHIELARGNGNGNDEVGMGTVTIERQQTRQGQRGELVMAMATW